jgi:DNA-binding phage protein
LPRADSGYFVTILESYKQYCANSAYRQLLDGEGFVHLPIGCLIINHPKYVTLTERGLELTEYARAHLDECCLCFRLGAAHKEDSDDEDSAGAGNASEKRRLKETHRRTPVFILDDHNMEVFSRSEELRRFHDELMEDARFLRETELDFAQLAAHYIRRRGYNKVVFCMKTHLSSKTYERIMSDELPNPALETVMAICLGLQLGIDDSERLLERAGFKLNASPLHLAYCKLLACRVGHDLDACNELLEALGLPIIGSPGN